MADPASWLVAEPGWEVVGADGKHIGQVKEILGDNDKDIFNGLAACSSRRSTLPRSWSSGSRRA